jgi:alpha-ribazole phosphatase
MLYLIRHTAPDIAPGICYGQLDIGLKDSFETEANTVMRLLPPFDLIITSPLLRCKKLAEHLARAHHCTMHTDARLMEKHFGLWEGRDWRDIARCEIDAWAADIMGYAPEGGESAQQLMLRVQDFMGDLAKLPQRNTVLITHGGTLRAMLAQLADIPLTNILNWQIEYGAVTGVNVLSFI